jgi:hypothetical protein
MKRTALFLLFLFSSSCVVITFKENHVHIHDNTGPVNTESDNSGSDPSGNDVSPSLDLPIIP